MNTMPDEFARRISAHVFKDENGDTDIISIKTELLNFNRGIVGTQAVTFTADEIMSITSQLWKLATDAKDGNESILHQDHMLFDELDADK